MTYEEQVQQGRTSPKGEVKIERSYKKLLTIISAIIIIVIFIGGIYFLPEEQNTIPNISQKEIELQNSITAYNQFSIQYQIDINKYNNAIDLANESLNNIKYANDQLNLLQNRISFLGGSISKSKYDPLKKLCNIGENCNDIQGPKKEEDVVAPQ